MRKGLLCLAFIACAEVKIGKEEVRVGVWSEFLSWKELKNVLPILLKYNIDIYPAVKVEDLTKDDFKNFLDEAEKLRVDVGLWVLLPKELGYWASCENAEEFYSLAVSAMQVAKSAEFLAVDLEVDINKVEELISDGFNPSALTFFIPDEKKEEEFARGVEIFKELVSIAHELGFKVLSTSAPMLVDDLEDGDISLQVSLGLPVSPVNWDYVSFMVYRTIFEQVAKQEFSPYLVYSYAQDIKRHFGERASVDLGVVGDIGIGIEKGYTSPSPLFEDISSAVSVGIRNVRIYSLDGIIKMSLDEKMLLEDWLDIEITHLVPESDFSTENLRRIFRALDEIF